jgi:hypothetical protein
MPSTKTRAPALTEALNKTAPQAIQVIARVADEPEPATRLGRHGDAVARNTFRNAVRAARTLLDRDETQRLQRLQGREARKLSGYKGLSLTDKHVHRHLLRLARTHSAEVFKNEEDLAGLIPPAPTKRRPNVRGHIHRSTLRASLARLEGAGIWTSWKTNGKLIGVLPTSHGAIPIRSSAIKVWRLSRTAWGRAWATLKNARPLNLYTVRAAAYLDGSKRGSRQSSRSSEGSPSGWRPAVDVPGWKPLGDVWREVPELHAADLAEIDKCDATYRLRTGNRLRQGYTEPARSPRFLPRAS